MKTKLHQFNVDIISKIFLLLGYATFYMYVIFTDQVRQYVHPRIVPYMIFTSIVMIIISSLLLEELLKGKKGKTNPWPLLFFMIPLIMAFVLPAKTFDSSTGMGGNFELSAGANVYRNSQGSLEREEEDEENFVGSEDVYEKNVSEIGIEFQNGVIVLDDDNFYTYLSEIYVNLDKYEGEKIEVVGFVFNDSEEFADNEFVPARLMMVCCAADMVPVGFLCRYDKARDLEKDSWVKVSGTITKSEFQGVIMPVINVTYIEKTDKPKYDYIYPY